MLKDILTEIKGNRAVKHGVRKTFYTLSYEFFITFNKIIQKMSYSKHLSIFIKESPGEYLEKNFARLPSYDIYCQDDVCFYKIDEETIIIPQKIKTFISKEYVEKIPPGYYISHPKNKEKYCSTNNFAIFNITKTIENLMKLSGLLKSNRILLKKTVSANNED